jgi:hypothetical protein
MQEWRNMAFFASLLVNRHETLKITTLIAPFTSTLRDFLNVLYAN